MQNITNAPINFGKHVLDANHGIIGKRMPSRYAVRMPQTFAIATLCKSTNDEYLMIPEYVWNNLKNTSIGISVISSPRVHGQK